MHNNSGIKIIGTGSFKPPFAVSNDDFTQYIETSDEWISARTGISERRMQLNGRNCDMAVHAAKGALSDSGCAAEEIDLVLVSTATPDYFYPTISCMAAKEIGAVNAACTDISAACTGFITAVDIARSYLHLGEYKKILVIASEKLTNHTDFSDRSTCVLFGDGAGAVVLERGEGFYSSFIGANAEFYDDMTIYCGVNYEPNYKFNGGVSPESPRHYLTMDGKAVYKFAVDAMPKAVNSAVKKLGMDIGDFDIIIPHQANIRIIKTAVKALGISMDKVYLNIERRGNTSSACIPSILDELKKSGKLKRGMKICMVAFGAGLTYGAACFEY